MIKISNQEYQQISDKIEKLEWVWGQYENKCPNEWYLFKYQSTIRLFLTRGGADYLLNQVHKPYFGHKWKLSIAVHQELNELARISHELSDIIDFPPYGSQLPKSLEQASCLIRQKEQR